MINNHSSGKIPTNLKEIKDSLKLMNIKLIEAKFEKYGLKGEAGEYDVNQDLNSGSCINFSASTNSFGNRSNSGDYLCMFANSYESVNTYKSKIKKIIQNTN